MRGIIFFLIYLLFASSIANADSARKEPETVFLQNDNTLKAMNYSKDDSNETIFYKNIVQTCPDNQCKLILINQSSTNNSFFKKESVELPLHQERPHSKNFLNVYSDFTLDKEKTEEAYKNFKEKGFDNSSDCAIIQADMAIVEKNFQKAEEFYKKALCAMQNDENIKMKLANCFRKQKKIKEAEQIYTEILEKNPNSIDAKINLAYLEFDKKNYKKAIQKFQKILFMNKDYEPAKMGLIYSYIGNNENMKALKLLNEMPESEEVKAIKANVYYVLDMYSNAKDALRGSITNDTIDLANKIKKARAFTFTPSYTFLNQELTEVYDLDIRKVGMNFSGYGAKNIKAFFDYSMYVYISGQYLDNHFTDFTNEIRGGLEGRPTEKVAFRSDIGVKVFQSGGAMLNTDSWIKYYVNDFFNYRLGFMRNNVEQSYLAAVGRQINGVFTGRVAINKAYVEIEHQLPNRYYYNLKGAGGTYNGQNLETNAFAECTLTVGKNVYKNSENRWIQNAAIEAVSYNTSFQTNLLNIPGALPPKNTFGGYFSPSFYTADTINFKIEGERKKWHLKYGLKGFVGPQFEFSPDFSGPAYGIFPYATYSLNNHLAVNLSYIYSNYASILRHFFMISVDIKV